MTEDEQRAAVIAEAETWLNTPFMHAQHVKGVGVDCGYFALAVHANVGTCKMVKFPYYTAQWLLHSNDEMYLREILKLTHEVDTPKPGDVALFKWARVFGHGAIVIDWPTRIIHPNGKSGVEYADATKFPFERKQVRFFSPWSS